MEYTFVSPVPHCSKDPYATKNAVLMIRKYHNWKDAIFSWCQIAPSPSFIQETSKCSEVPFFLFFSTRNYFFEWTSRNCLFARLKILPITLLRMQYLGTVQNGRHKSTSLNIFSHLVKLHAHVQHTTCIDHIPGRQWLATTKEPHKCPPHVSLTFI